MNSDETEMREDDDRLAPKPAQPKSLLAALATLRSLVEAFPPIAELPVDPVKL